MKWSWEDERWQRDKGEMVMVWKLTMILRLMGIQETSGLERLRVRHAF